MSKQNLNTEKLNISEREKFPVDCLVGMPPLQLNEIYNDDSFELCKRVPAKTVDLILEDMPYNTTACEWDVKIDLQLYWETRLRMLKPTGVVILTASQPFTTILASSNLSMLKYEWIWDKKRGSNFLALKTQPMKEHENILIFGNIKTFNPIKTKRNSDRNKRSYNFDMAASEVYGGMKSNAKRNDETDRHPKSIIEYELEVNNQFEIQRYHPTQKPVGLFEYLIRTYTNEGDLVFDGFGGSGTTAVAAHKAKRNFIVIEKEKKYFDLAVRRLDIERAQYTML